MREEAIRIKGDSIQRRGDTEWSAELNPMYEVQLPPRCSPLPVPYKHRVGLRFYTLRGNTLFEAGGEKTVVKQGHFIFVPAGVEYRFSGCDHSPSTLLVQAKSEQVEESWRQVAELLRNQR